MRSAKESWPEVPDGGLLNAYGYRGAHLHRGHDGDHFRGAPALIMEN